jgi:hypothetical protein
MPQYLLSVCQADEDLADLPPDDMQRIGPKVDAVNQRMQDAGAWVFAGGLMPASTATVVRADDGELTMTDGPFAETKEQMAGFWIIEVPDLDAALDWARQGTVACETPIEVRALRSEADIPDSPASQAD